MSPEAAVTAARRKAAPAQRWAGYRPEEHRVWAALYRRRMATLPTQASRRFLDGLDAIGLVGDRIPHLGRLNARLRPRTGWSAVPVGGYLPPVAFFRRLARRRFPTTVTVRAPESLDYTPEPDIFHDVFGHVPLHADPVFADWLARFGAIAATAGDPGAAERLARLFWFTVEFGLSRERGGIRIYGSGLISSAAEAEHALGPGCERRRFDVHEVLATPFVIDELQRVLFVIDGFETLFATLDAVAVKPGPARRRRRSVSPSTRP